MIARERFGKPQVYALLLLFAFLAESVWASHVQPLSRIEVAYVQAGLDQFHGRPLDPNAPTVPVAAAAFPVLVSGGALRSYSADTLKWMVRLPFLAFGWLLGASIWYVSRRLYGNAGGYLALVLFCFSVFIYYSLPGPVLSGSLGCFGMIFLSIAVAHTLYAPARAPAGANSLAAVLGEMKSRWYRIVLLGISIALAVGSSYWTVFLLVLAIAFIAYLVPERQYEGQALLAAACALAFLILWALHGFHWHPYITALRHARWMPVNPRAVQMGTLHAYLSGIWQGGRPVLLAMALLALAAYVIDRRSRYFGNTAPLLVVAALTVFGLISMYDIFSGGFPVRAEPFVFVFIGGVFADLVESRWRTLVMLVTVALVAVYVTEAVMTLVRTRFSVLY